LWTILAFLGTAIVVTVYVKQPKKSAKLLEKVTTAYSAILYTGLFHNAFIKAFSPAESLEVTPQPYPFGKVDLGVVLRRKANLVLWLSGQ
jgi:hypothetical protein